MYSREIIRDFPRNGQQSLPYIWGIGIPEVWKCLQIPAKSSPTIIVHFKLPCSGISRELRQPRGVENDVIVVSIHELAAVFKIPGLAI
jgi:hypothetical protein